MNQTFTVDLVKMKCFAEQVGEPGSDEVYLIGFGVSGKGQRFYPKIISIGSFSDGDVTSDDYRASLFQETFVIHENVVATTFIVFERDSGDISESVEKITDYFNKKMDQQIEINQSFGDYKFIHSFALTMMQMPEQLGVYGEDFWNSDDVDGTCMYIDHFVGDFLERPADRTKHHFRIATATGVYAFEFEARFSPPDPVLDAGFSGIG